MTGKETDDEFLARMKQEKGLPSPSEVTRLKGIERDRAKAKAKPKPSKGAD